MTDSTSFPNQGQPPEGPSRNDSASQVSPEATGAGADPNDKPVEAVDPSLGDTAGCGSVIAIACIGATLFLILIGLLYLGVTQLFG